MSVEVEHRRCQDARACVEVTARLDAVDKAVLDLGIAHDDPAVVALRQAAARFAEAHHRGTRSAP